MHLFSVTKAVHHGYHVNKDIWEQTIDEVLSCERELATIIP